MNQLDSKRQAQVIAALVEGNSIRSTVRMTGVAKRTVLKLLADIGEARAKYQDEKMRIYVASVCSVMKFGRSAMRKKRMFLLA